MHIKHDIKTAEDPFGMIPFLILQMMEAAFRCPSFALVSLILRAPFAAMNLS